MSNITSTSPATSAPTTTTTTTTTTTPTTEVTTTTTYTTEWSTTTTITTTSESLMTTKAIVGIVAGVVVLTVFIVILVVLLRRRRKRKKPAPPELPHPDSINPVPLENGTSRWENSASQSTASLVRPVDEDPHSSYSYEDPDTAATVPVIKNRVKKKEDSGGFSKSSTNSTNSQLYQNLQPPPLTHSQVSSDESSFGVYVQPVEKRPTAGREASGGFDSTYIPMGGPCGHSAAIGGVSVGGASAQVATTPTHPDALYKEGLFEQVYTAPTTGAGPTPPPAPCGITNVGYVNLPQSPLLSGPSSLDLLPIMPVEAYVNLPTSGNHRYGNINHNPIALPSPASDGRVLLPLPPDAGAKPKSQTPPKTNPKPKTKKFSTPSAVSPASSTAELGNRGDKPHSPKTKVANPLRVPPSTPPKPASPMTPKSTPPSTPLSLKAAPSRSAEVSSDSDEGESYENMPEGAKRDYQNVPSKKTDPHGGKGPRRESPLAAGDGPARLNPAATPKKKQAGAKMLVSDDITDELKKKLGRPK